MTGFNSPAMLAEVGEDNVFFLSFLRAQSPRPGRSHGMHMNTNN